MKRPKGATGSLHSPGHEFVPIFVLVPSGEWRHARRAGCQTLEKTLSTSLQKVCYPQVEKPSKVLSAWKSRELELYARREVNIIPLLGGGGGAWGEGKIKKDGIL